MQSSSWPPTFSCARAAAPRSRSPGKGSRPRTRGSSCRGSRPRPSGARRAGRTPAGRRAGAPSRRLRAAAWRPFEFATTGPAPLAATSRSSRSPTNTAAAGQGVEAARAGGGEGRADLAPIPARNRREALQVSASSARATRFPPNGSGCRPSRRGAAPPAPERCGGRPPGDRGERRDEPVDLGEPGERGEPVRRDAERLLEPERRPGERVADVDSSPRSGPPSGSPPPGARPSRAARPRRRCGRRARSRRPGWRRR